MLFCLLRSDGEVCPVDSSARSEPAVEAVEATAEVTFVEAFTAIFWPAYPRKVARLAAFRAWKALRLRDDDQATLDLIMDGLERAKRAWSLKDRQFIPHAATWLNGHRWEDEE